MSKTQVQPWKGGRGTHKGEEGVVPKKEYDTLAQGVINSVTIFSGWVGLPFRSIHKTKVRSLAGGKTRPRRGTALLAQSCWHRFN